MVRAPSDLTIILMTSNLKAFYTDRKELKKYISAGREIAPNTGANATKFFTLATKS